MTDRMKTVRATLQTITEQQVLFNTAAAVARPAKSHRWTAAVGRDARDAWSSSGKH
jgi:hypothetical protein